MELPVKRHELILLWESFFYANSWITPKNFAKFHFCTFLLIQFSYTNVYDISLTQQTMFHSSGGRKKGKKHFPFALFQDSCSQEGLAQEGLVQNGSAMGLTSFCKNTVLILEVFSVAEIPLTNRIHFTWFTSNPFTDIKLVILQDIQCLHFPLKWNTVLQQNHLQCHDLPLSP